MSVIGVELVKLFRLCKPDCVFLMTPASVGSDRLSGVRCWSMVQVFDAKVIILCIHCDWCEMFSPENLTSDICQSDFCIPRHEKPVTWCGLFLTKLDPLWSTFDDICCQTWIPSWSLLAITMHAVWGAGAVVVNHAVNHAGSLPLKTWIGRSTQIWSISDHKIRDIRIEHWHRTPETEIWPKSDWKCQEKHRIRFARPCRVGDRGCNTWNDWNRLLRVRPDPGWQAMPMGIDQTQI